MTEHKCGCKGSLDFYTVGARETNQFIAFSKSSVFAITVTKEEDRLDEDYWILTIHMTPGDTELTVTSGTWAHVMHTYCRICEKLGISTTDLTEY